MHVESGWYRWSNATKWWRSSNGIGRVQGRMTQRGRDATRATPRKQKETPGTRRAAERHLAEHERVIANSMIAKSKTLSHRGSRRSLHHDPRRPVSAAGDEARRAAALEARHRKVQAGCPRWCDEFSDQCRVARLAAHRDHPKPRPRTLLHLLRHGSWTTRSRRDDRHQQSNVYSTRRTLRGVAAKHVRQGVCSSRDVMVAGVGTLGA